MTTSGISARVARRWQAIDPLLPAPVARPPGCGADIVVAGPDGEPIATGTCEHWEGVPGSLDLCWGATRRFQLNAQIAGPDVAAALDRLLSLWRDHLALVPGTEAQDTAAVVTWPSRDIDGVKPLLRHGLTPLTVAAVRSTGRCAGPGDGVPRPGAGDARSAGPPAVVRFTGGGGCVMCDNSIETLLRPLQAYPAPGVTIGSVPVFGGPRAVAKDFMLLKAPFLHPRK